MFSCFFPFVVALLEFSCVAYRPRKLLIWPRLTLINNPLLGIRVGEASNPGPPPPGRTYTFAVLNPTVLTDRQQDIIDLNADCISLAETSATTTVQTEFTKFARKADYSVLWSPPVSPHKHMVNPLALDTARRGEALGTASLHRTPHRPSRNELPSHLQATFRVSQEIVPFGAF